MPEEPTKLADHAAAKKDAKKDKPEGKAVAKKKPEKPVRAFAIFEDAQKIAVRLMAKMEGLEEIRRARFLYLSTSRDKVGRDGAANATKYAEWAKAVREYDFVLQFSRPAWNHYTPTQREALVYHELLHCRIDAKGRAQLVGHDLEEFSLVVKHYGIWDPRVKQMHEQMVLWVAEADGSASVATPTRSAARKK